MTWSEKYDPYQRPTPYEVLSLPEGPKATVRDVARAYNDQLRRNQREPDAQKRGRRRDELNRARDRILRPDDRVLLDFFLPDHELFAELCCRYAGQVASGELPVAPVLDSISRGRPYDDLVSEALDGVAGPLPELGEFPFHDEPPGPERLTLAELEP